MKNDANQRISITKASVKIMEGIVQNTPELGNPNQSEHVYETTESKVRYSWRNRFFGELREGKDGRNM